MYPSWERFGFFVDDFYDMNRNDLTYVDNENYRRSILTQLNRGESRQELARAIFHGKKGEIRK